MKSESDNAANARWAAANQDKLREYRRNWARRERERDPERVRARDRAWRARQLANDPNWGKAYHRQYHSGVTPEHYEEMLSAQEGCCAICGAHEDRRLHADHDHATGAARGLLCGRCNTAIGSLHDSPAILRLAIEYLEHFKNSEGENDAVA